MKIQPQSGDAVCCEIRSWALGIGWLQSIGCALLFLSSVVEYIMLNYDVQQQAETEIISTESMELVLYFGLALFIIVGLSMLLQVALGIVLIMGVKQKSAHKLKVWCIFQIIFLAVLALVFGVLSRTEFSFLIYSIIGTLINIFCICIVNIHRQNLMPAEQPCVSGSEGIEVNYYGIY